MRNHRITAGMALLCGSLLASAPVFAQGSKKPAPKPATVPATKPASKPAPKPKPTETTDAPGTAPTASAESGRIWALLVGVSKYRNPQIATLRYPAADATGIRDALVDKELGGIPAANVHLLTDDQATAAGILAAVDTFLTPNVRPGDQVVLFLAGHGVAKGAGAEAKSYLLPTDTKGLTTPSLDSSAVNLRTLSDKLGKLPARQFVVFVDACREDPTPGRGIKGNTMSDVLSRGVRIVSEDPNRPAASASFFACSIGQRAFEDPALNHGVFTYWILDGIRTAAAARRPDGAIDMGVLAGYVRQKVGGWAKQASEKGDFEVEQTPEFVASDLTDPIILMRVKKPLPPAPAQAPPPRVIVLANPPGAQVLLDNQRMGAAPLTVPISSVGRHTLKIEAPGYAPLEREFTALAGYDLLLTVSPTPDARGASGENVLPEMYRRALDAESRQQWEVAEAGYTAVLQSDPSFVPAYERLADLRRRRGNPRTAIETLTQMVTKTPATAHGLSLLSVAYAELSLKEAPLRTSGSTDKPKKKGGLLGGLLNKGDKNEKGKDEDFSGGPATYLVPKDWKDAAILARRAAEEAVRLDANAPEAQRALGFALMATDSGGKNQETALAAFGKALLFGPNDPANHYGMGYGIRFFALHIRDENARKTELDRAVAELKEALRLRPEYYEAHRELAYCYHLQDKAPEAQKEYESANANRGAASDPTEVAALNLSLASIYRQRAQGASGPKQAALLAASEGYFGDARDITPNLEQAVRYLTNAQLSTRIANFMPPELQKVLDLPDDLRRKLKIPGGVPLPRFP
ncbi:MAG: caspase family protein [Capsulimonadales bacterium]|nr:caspase family protein [Capsulimonadales bacterium]